MGKSSYLIDANHLVNILFHFREHIPYAYRKSQDELTLICCDYRLIQDISNVSKHNTLTKNNPQVTNTDSVFERLIITEYCDEKGKYNHLSKVIIVKLNDGTERDLHNIIVNVMNMWLNEMYTLGVLTSQKTIKLKRKNRIPKRKTPTMVIEILKGVAFSQKIQYLRYNYETKSIEPINLTGKELRFNLYRRPEPKYQYFIQLEAHSKDLSEPLTVKLEVTEVQKNIFEALSSLEEQIDYFNKLQELQDQT